MNPFNNTIYIQAQDTSGVWRTYSVTVNDPQVILMSMQSLKQSLPTFRIRAVDSVGRLVDILT
jgi:hypothetical protein